MANPNHDELGRFSEGDVGPNDRLDYASAGAGRGGALPKGIRTGDKTTDAALKDPAAIKTELEQYQKLKEAGLKQLAQSRAERAASTQQGGERINYASAGAKRK